MDVTSTAQVLGNLQPLVSGGLSANTLVLAAGVLSSHAAQGFAEKIPAPIRPLAIALGSIVVTAGAAVSAGTDWRTALGYGLGSAVVGKLYYTGILKPGGPLSALLALVAKSSTSTK